MSVLASILSKLINLPRLSFWGCAILGASLAFSAEGAGKKRLPSYGKFRTTFYYVVNEAKYPSTQESAIKDLRGDVISQVNSRFKRDLDMEGTGFLRDGRTVNYMARVENEIRYRVSPLKWGWGVGQCGLRPYRTVAIDPSLVPLGTIVFIPAAKGVVLPDGTVHDGIFFAEDVGSAIQGKHVDFFAQEGPESSQPFEKAGIKTWSLVEIFKYKDPDPHGCHSLPPYELASSLSQNLANQLKGL